MKEKTLFPAIELLASILCGPAGAELGATTCRNDGDQDGNGMSSSIDTFGPSRIIMIQRVGLFHSALRRDLAAHLYFSRVNIYEYQMQTVNALW
jgi:hypothetical protein